MGKRIFLSLLIIMVSAFGLIFPAEAGGRTLFQSGRRPSSESSDLFDKIRDDVKKTNLKAAQELLEKELAKTAPNEVQDLLKFQLGYIYFLQGAFEKSALTFHEFLQLKSRLEDYGRYFMAQDYLKLGKDREAEEELKKIAPMSPNLKLKNESELDLAMLALKQKKYKDARNRLQALEKRARGTDRYPEVIYQLAVAEKGLANQSRVCQWSKKLYEKFPVFERVLDWGFDLAENKILNDKTLCKTNLDDFKSRVRYLMWAGLDEKTQSEINSVRSKMGKENRYAADELQAQYFLQEGEPRKAVDLLKPYYGEFRKNFNFLILYASASARAGDVQVAVGTYYEAYRLSPKSKQARQALYQAAFLSYQFQDYDGAGRRFREFLKVYPKSGLTRDAQWNLAWLQYLKSDFKGSYAALNQLTDQKKTFRKKTSDDRIDYWKAMSLYRMGKIEQAKNIFEKLSADRLLGYYSIAASERLKKISAASPGSGSGRSIGDTSRRITRFSWNEFLIASPDGSETAPVAGATGEKPNVPEEAETEEAVAANLAPAVTGGEESEESEGENIDDRGKSEVLADGTLSDFKSPALASRFEKARDLMIVGLDDWAKWDLYEIERSTKNREYLRTLMSEYSTVEHYHRSSYLGQTVFSPARAAQGILGVRFLWEYAYPQAYANYVGRSAKEFKIPSELVWGIMKAESQYRRDAISPVGALGLMQVMPFTGKKVAGLLGENNFKASQLLEPPTAIRIGARYLSRLMQKFDQEIPFVAAAYNAGPHRVRTWLAYFGGLDMDEFIEHIPFLETRNYVKRVISNSYVYGQLYGQQKTLPLNLSDPIKMKVDQLYYSKETWDEI